MKPILIIISLFILNSQFSILNARIWEIKQDGTGDFTTITAGIDAAVNGDTLIVHRGIYYENIHYGHKNIVITSLYGIESDDRSIIRETVIDGNRQGSVVTFLSRQITRDAVLSGFTIRNGAVFEEEEPGGPLYSGGGITVIVCTPIIRYCIVEHNYSAVGAGGIQSYIAGPLLIGNTVRYNHSKSAGGISISGGFNDNLPYATELCSEELNSVYLNHGNSAQDITIAYTRQESVVIDTLTVRGFDPYFVMLRNDYQMPRDFSLTINHGKIEPVEADLYVSPYGCDTNSGLTPEEPLQRIATAIARIQPDEQQQRTVHLAEGIYSHSLNNQLFPLSMRNNTVIAGADKETTILDGEHTYYLIAALYSAVYLHEGLSNFSVKNLTITRGHRGSNRYGALFCRFVTDFTLENINFTNSGSPEYIERGTHKFIVFEGCDNFTLRNIGIYNNDITTNRWGEAILSAHRMESGQTFYAENIRIRDNYSPNGPSRIFVQGTGRPPQSYHATFVNLEITDNAFYPHGHWGYGALLNIDAKVRLINATIAGNRVYNVNNPAAISMGNYLSPELSVYNSIFYDNGGDYQMFFSRHPSHGGGPDVINVSHSLIENGREGITEIYDVGSIVNWGAGNIDDDPLFVGHYDEYGNEKPNPYMLTEDSPARGAGTLDIPDFEFPEFDLAGNPRIVDGRIDMGAYQWHPPEGRERVRRGDPSRERQIPENFGLRNFPNPVTYLHSERQAGQTRSSTGTNISFTLPDNGKVTVEIYNLKGQFVKRLFDAYIPKGEHNIFWDGRDERGRYVATGFYMYNLLFNEQVVATGRATFIK